MQHFYGLPDNIILRDMLKSDLEDYVHWFTSETEWVNTDAPWGPMESDTDILAG
mgnify:CR=1 FL=1